MLVRGEFCAAFDSGKKIISSVAQIERLYSIDNCFQIKNIAKRMSDDEDTKVSITLRTIVTGPEAGCIIGRGGEAVNNIRDESGAKIRIEGSSQQERIITVDGPTDSIFKVRSSETLSSVTSSVHAGVHPDL